MQGSDKLEVSSSGKLFLASSVIYLDHLQPKHPKYMAGGDSAWEKVSNFAESGEDIPSAKDDYAALTAQLAATGPAAGTRAKARRPALPVSPFLFCSLASHCLPYFNCSWA